MKCPIGIIVLFAVIAAAAGGCQAKRAADLPTASESVVPANSINGLAMSVWANAGMGQATKSPPPVEIRVTLRNVGPDPLRLLLPQMLYLSQSVPPDAMVVVRVSSEEKGHAIHVVGTAEDGVREVVLAHEMATVVYGKIARGAWTDSGDVALPKMRVSARYVVLTPPLVAATIPSMTRPATAPTGRLWTGRATAGPIPFAPN